MTDFKDKIEEEFVDRLVDIMSEKEEDKTKEDIKNEIISKYDIQIVDDHEGDEEEEEEAEEIEATAEDLHDEAVLVWRDGNKKDTSIEINPDKMEPAQKYNIDYNEQKLYIQKKDLGNGRFEIGIFQQENI